MRAVVICSLAAAIASLGGPRAALADDARLAEARAHKQALRYQEAREVLLAALAEGTRGPSELIEIYAMLGEVTAGIDAPDEARDHFARLLCLSPEFRLPAGASPKIAEPFASARALIERTGPLAIRAVTTGEASIALAVESDPLGMVAGARAHDVARSGAVAVEARGTGRIELRFPRGEPVQIALAAIDQHGNELAVLGSGTAPLVVGGRPRGDGIARGDRRHPARPWLGRWYVWAGASVALAGAGVGFGLAARDAESDLDALNRSTRDRPFELDFADAEELRDRGERWALLSNVGFALSGAAALAAATLFVVGLDDDDTQPLVTPHVGDGARGVIVTLPF